jgi:hypothetical protein
MKQVLSVLALAAAAGLASPAFAQTYRATASGPAESPPNGSPGNSVATLDLRFDPGTSTLTVDMPFSDLVGSSTAAHIHCCTTDAFTGTSGIAIPFADFPTGVKTGSFSATLPLYEEATYDPAFLAANGGSVKGAASAFVDGLNANEAYVNIHTSAYPDGEIRGFIVAAPIPEPSEWALLAGGLGALMWVSRRRRPETIWQR